MCTGSDPCDIPNRSPFLCMHGQGYRETRSAAGTWPVAVNMPHMLMKRAFMYIENMMFNFQRSHISTYWNCCHYYVKIWVADYYNHQNFNILKLLISLMSWIKYIDFNTNIDTLLCTATHTAFSKALVQFSHVIKNFDIESGKISNICNLKNYMY